MMTLMMTTMTLMSDLIRGGRKAVSYFFYLDGRYYNTFCFHIKISKNNRR